MSARAAAVAALVLAAVGAPAVAATRVHVSTAVSPQPSRFGDVIHATLTVRAGSAATVQQGFAPFQVLRTTSTSARARGVVTTTWRFDLQCLDAGCAPGPGPRRVTLSASRVRIGTQVIVARFPVVQIDPRVTQKQVGAPSGSFEHPTTPPAPAFRFAPSTTRRVLVGAALLLVLVALLLALPVLRPRRARAARAQADALARALALVRAARVRPPPDRRRALGLLSRTLRTRGEETVGQAVADLAWSEPDPDPTRMTQLADRIEGAP